jgi:hypothetical protein
MVTTNKSAVPPAVIQKVSDYLNKALTELEPYTVTQPPKEDRRRIGLGDKSLSFVEKSLTYASLNPKLVPSYLDMKAFEADFADFQELRGLWNTAAQVLGKITNRRKAAGCGAIEASLQFYGSVIAAAEQDAPGAKPIRLDLKARFPRKGKKKAKETPDPAQPAAEQPQASPPPSPPSEA